MFNDPSVPASDPKDTSLPDREEEVIVNDELQGNIVNKQVTSPEAEDEGIKRFQEGIGDNDNTEVPVK